MIWRCMEFSVILLILCEIIGSGINELGVNWQIIMNNDCGIWTVFAEPDLPDTGI